MKRALLPILAFSAAWAAHAQTVLLAENFDAHAAGELAAQTLGLPWTTWSNAPGGAEDTPLSEEQAFSGGLSMKFLSTNAATGGPTDVVLRLGDRTSGQYGLTWKMYIPTGQGAYFNLQHDETPGVEWAIDVTFPPGGTGSYNTNGVLTPMTFPHDTWFDVVMAIDLDGVQGVISVNGGLPHIWAFDTQVEQGGGAPGMNQLGAVNFYAYAGGTGTTTYYIDDVTFLDVTGVGLAENSVTGPAVYPNPAQDLLTVELPTGSIAAVASLVDATGRTVVDGRPFQQNTNGARAQLDLQGLPAGVYFVRVRNGAEELVRRVAKL